MRRQVSIGPIKKKMKSEKGGVMESSQVVHPGLSVHTVKRTAWMSDLLFELRSRR